MLHPPSPGKVKLTEVPPVIGLPLRVSTRRQGVTFVN